MNSRLMFPDKPPSYLPACDETLYDDVPYYPYLYDLQYMDMAKLALGVTINFDGKHLAKRMRNNIKWKFKDMVKVWIKAAFAFY